jgi:predicted Zn-dependent protease
LYEARADLSATVETRWYVNSEGTQIQVSEPSYRLFVYAFSKADDGMELPRYETFFATTPEGLPSDQVVFAAVDKMIRDLHALRRRRSSIPTRAAILSGRAAACSFMRCSATGSKGTGRKTKTRTDVQEA